MVRLAVSWFKSIELFYSGSTTPSFLKEALQTICCYRTAAFSEQLRFPNRQRFDSTKFFRSVPSTGLPSVPSLCWSHIKNARLSPSNNKNARLSISPVSSSSNKHGCSSATSEMPSFFCKPSSSANIKHTTLFVNPCFPYHCCMCYILNITQS